MPKIKMNDYLELLGFTSEKPKKTMKIKRCDCGEYADYIEIEYHLNDIFKMEMKARFICIDCMNKENQLS